MEFLPPPCVQRKLYIGLFLLSLIPFSAGFMCYQCNSLHDKYCKDIDITNKSQIYLKPCVGVEEKVRLIHCTNNDDAKCKEEIGKQLRSNNCTNGNATLPINETISSACDQIRLRNAYEERTELELNYTMCRKITIFVYETHVTKEGDTEIQRKMLTPRISRQCGHENENEDYYDTCVRKRSLSTSQTTCTCHEEKCNSGDRLTFTFVGFLFVTLLALLVRNQS